MKYFVVMSLTKVQPHCREIRTTFQTEKLDYTYLVPIFRDMKTLLLFLVKKNPELTVSSVAKSAYDPILVLIMVPGISGSTIPKNPFSISAKDVQDCA